MAKKIDKNEELKPVEGAEIKGAPEVVDPAELARLEAVKQAAEEQLAVDTAQAHEEDLEKAAAAHSVAEDIAEAVGHPLDFVATAESAPTVIPESEEDELDDIASIEGDEQESEEEAPGPEEVEQTPESEEDDLTEENLDLALEDLGLSRETATPSVIQEKLRAKMQKLREKDLTDEVRQDLDDYEDVVIRMVEKFKDSLPSEIESVKEPEYESAPTVIPDSAETQTVIPESAPSSTPESDGDELDDIEAMGGGDEEEELAPTPDELEATPELAPADQPVEASAINNLGRARRPLEENLPGRDEFKVPGGAEDQTSAQPSVEGATPAPESEEDELDNIEAMGGEDEELAPGPEEVEDYESAPIVVPEGETAPEAESGGIGGAEAAAAVVAATEALRNPSAIREADRVAALGIERLGEDARATARDLREGVAAGDRLAERAIDRGYDDIKATVRDLGTGYKFVKNFDRDYPRASKAIKQTAFAAILAPALLFKGFFWGAKKAVFGLRWLKNEIVPGFQQLIGQKETKFGETPEANVKMLEELKKEEEEKKKKEEALRKKK